VGGRVGEWAGTANGRHIMDEEVPGAVVVAAAAAARALMRGQPVGEDAVIEGIARAALGVAGRFCGIVPTDWDAVPAPVRHGVAMLIQHLAEDRPGDVPPAAVAALWRPYRRVRLA